ncbi:MAG: choloylglycine hydrolase [Ruminococcus sp.]
MCTAISFNTQDFYFGRNLDYDFLYPCEVTVTPRNFPIKLRFGETIKSHDAIIGMAYICDDYPLYFDAMNESGLCMAGLNFVGNAFYSSPDKNLCNICQFEFIPYILSTCKSVSQAREKILNISITDTPFSNNLPVAQLHWMISDEKESITVEAVKEGLFIYDNTVGVLTNNPPFKEQLQNLNNYINLSPYPAENRFSNKIDLVRYSLGMGAIGLPGDYSSQSRFVRASFVKLNSCEPKGEAESVSQFFHILNSVSQPKGVTRLDEKNCEITLYTSCFSVSKGIYYYNTYSNRQITAVNMNNEDLTSSSLIRFPLIASEQIKNQN